MLEVPIWLVYILGFLAIPGLYYLIEGIPLLLKEIINRMQKDD